jgi:dolichol-phosphate mannosyltransferase
MAILPTSGSAVLPPRLSVVVPVKNEAGNIAGLVSEIRAALAAIPYEIVYIDDGSGDATPMELWAAANEGRMTVLRHRVSCGQSAAVVSGVRAARGQWIATLDGDGQNDPADIPAILVRAEAELAAGGGPVLIAGHRVTRKDTAIKRISSRLANRVRAAILRDATPDTGCGLKIFEREVFLKLPAFDHMHRYLPALFMRAGGRVVSVPVNHRQRGAGRSNYGTLDRALVGALDLFGVWWLMRRGKVAELVRDRTDNPQR